MRLSTRLILLTVGCLLPTVMAQVYSQVNLHTERLHQLDALAEQQAWLANADLAGILDDAGQLGAAVEQFPEMRNDATACSSHLNALHEHLPRYRFLALVAPNDASVICASDGAAGALTGSTGAWLRDLQFAQSTTVGPLAGADDRNDGFLPIGIYLPGFGIARPAILVAALDADWITGHLTAAEPVQDLTRAQTALIVADRDGMIVSRTPRPAEPAGRSLPKWLMPLAGRESAGTSTVTDDQGNTYIAAYVPSQAPPRGLTVITLLPLHALTADIDRATQSDLLVIVGAAVMAMLLAWVAGRRFIYRPTEALLQAARKWREGDLKARAEMPGGASEFALLAQSFNAMAAGLAARETERLVQARVLEDQVAERTRELSETNNRLQVEIAGREKTEAALHQAQKLQAVGQLAGGIAHDFNNLLATVLGNLELMERRVAQASEAWPSAESERLQRLIERAVGAVQRGSQLTSRLLAFSRRQRLAARPTDINALLQELITLATSTLGRRVQVVPELSEDLWPALVDPSQVEAAILNLCLNARDAMPEGGRLTIQTSNVTVSGGEPNEKADLAPGNYVQICIADTGVGMSPEVRARAFDPFFTTKGPGAGSGLGLSQVYGMARQSGGNVFIDSEPNAGTRVILNLPRATADIAAEEAQPAAPSSAEPAADAKHELILVVDDDHAVRQVTVEMARDLHYDVAQAAGGDQALALLDKLSPPPRLILLDYAMPGMNGLQLARAMRQRGVTAPIALVTGYAELSETDIHGGELAGLLRKPFTIRELQALLQQLRASAGESSRLLETGLAER